jgi:thiol-disulfide isomerase/thioredoxin
VRRPRVVLYKATGCHLCERAETQLDELHAELAFELEKVTIDGDAALEARYREWLPVVEVDGERFAVYHLQPGPFRRRIAAAQTPADETSL